MDYLALNTFSHDNVCVNATYEHRVNDPGEPSCLVPACNATQNARGGTRMHSGLELTCTVLLQAISTGAQCPR